MIAETSLLDCEMEANIQLYESRMDKLSTEQVKELYHGILDDIPISGVTHSIVSYVTSLIEPIGWKALWTPLNSNSHSGSHGKCLVDVQNVSLINLEAEVTMLEMIPEKSNVTRSPDSAFDDYEAKPGENFIVSILELYPLKNENVMIEKTAEVLEHVRFFYANIWRPWDENDDGDCIFADTLLDQRLQFYFDVKSKKISPSLAKKAKCILQEGQAISYKLRGLYTEMDQDVELDEKDVAETIALQRKLESLQKDMEMLENPILRNVFVRHETCPISVVADRNYPVAHVVGVKFSLGCFQDIAVDPNCTLEFHHDLNSAIDNCISGDIIQILPGEYQLNDGIWIDKDITIQGLGKVLLIAMEGDAFVNCWSNINLTNLSFQSNHPLDNLVTVHKGTITFQHCIFLGNDSQIGIAVLSGAKASCIDTTISNIEDSGIAIHKNAGLELRNCSISKSAGDGLVVDSGENTTVFFENSEIKNNAGFGVRVMCCEDNISQVRTFEELQRSSLLMFQKADLKISENQAGEVFVESCKQKHTECSQENKDALAKTIHFSEDI